MWLILCHVDDLPALWLHEKLEEQGDTSVELITAEYLAGSLRWEHRVNSDQASLMIELADGRVIRSGDVQGTVNRIRFAPFPMQSLVEEGDREYLQQELSAFYLSWLHALPGTVLNPASPNGMNGAWRPDIAWTRLAVLAGLRCAPPSQDAPLWANFNTIIVVGGTTTNPGAPPEIAARCLRLAARAQTPLIGVNFELDEAGNWLFRAATATPDFRLGEEAFVRGVRAALGLGKGNA
jgi:hypothetical protein